MKKIIIMMVLSIVVACKPASAQQYEIQQLLLDVQKLSQLKQILSDMKTGYEVVSKGYTTIRDIAQGNFNLHEAFLDGLWLVSPTVRKYWKIPAIINYQVALVKEYKGAYSNFSNSGYFNPDEITYMGKVYSNLLDLSLKNLGDLTTIVTANQLRMSDDERMTGIDKIYSDIQDEVMFLRHFNNNNTVLGVQRAKEQHDITGMQQLYGLP